ncbi:MAG: outer membrane channel protein TolC [Gammaproteobacteria bacterium CG22_combo_CG10-13_8_21_14_all_40_8]|nr:MAG: outer membrane channel protein TolC [Gammaproteobacteria bacterium CG22_combo_CG10-13_8_21_14_all_40_8]
MLFTIHKRFLSATILCMFTAIPSANAENLLELYQKAIDSDPVYLSSASKAESGQEGIAQAKAKLLPTISASASRQRSNNTSSGVQVFNGIAFPGSETTDITDTDSFQLRLSEEVYHHDSWIALSQAEKRAKQAQMSYDVEKQNLIIRVAASYFNVLAALDSLEFAQAEKESVGKQLEQTKQRFDVGLIAQTDVHEAQAKYDQATASEITSQNQVDDAYEALREITGTTSTNLARLNTTIPLVKPQPDNISDWESVAERSNINLISNQLATEIAREEIKRQFAGHFPTVDFNASYSDSSSTGTSAGLDDNNVSSKIGTGRDFAGTTVSLSVSIPIFSGGSTSSSVRKAQYDYKIASQDLERVHREVTKQTRSAFRTIIANISSIKALTQSQISNQSALEATKAGFDVGTRTMVDVLLSTTNLYNAKRTLARSRYDYVMNVLRLKQAAGILTQDDLIKVNGWLQH